MTERLLILVGLVVAVGAAWGLVRLWRASRVRQLAGDAPLAGVVPVGRPAVVSFSTPSCTECRTRQAPALQRLSAALGADITIASLSALEHPDLVDKLGVLTVPATAVVDGRGALRHLNLGFADDTRLADQLRGLL